MRQHPVFHLGFPKCASTFLQRQIFPNLRTYTYLEANEETKEIIRYYPHEVPKNTTLARIAGSRAIVSRERFLSARLSPLLFADHMVNASMWNLRQLYGDNITLLIVIRRQDDLVRSRFRHKHSSLLREDLYFLDYPAKGLTGWKTWNFQTRGGVYLTSYDYLSRLMPLAQLFGKDRVRVLLYEDLVADRAKFFSDLSAALDEDVSFLIPRASAKENVSKRQAPPPNPILKKINRLTNGLTERLLPERTVDVSADFAQRLMDIYRDGNKRLSSYFELGLDRHGYF